MNPEGKEIVDPHFQKERINCIYKDCHYLNNAMERRHLKDLLRGTKFNQPIFS
jgi:hypothetical protein